MLICALIQLHATIKTDIFVPMLLCVFLGSEDMTDKKPSLK